MKIVFLGTPDFAVATLDILVKNGYEVVGVVTAPDKPAGRGMQLTMSAVKQYALDKGLMVLQPTNLKNPEFLEALKALNADLQVVVAFRMLPEAVWNMPPLGTINVHASLLPQYRGAAPINWAVINGEAKSGVTTFRLKHVIDTGNILLQDTAEITPDMTAGELHDILMQKGAQLLLKTVQQQAAGTLQEQPQDHLDEASLKHAPKLHTETCIIRFDQPAQQVHNMIRGLSPYPTAFTSLQDKKLKVFRSKPENASHNLAPGTVETDHKTYLKFATPDGFIDVQELQLEGKKRMLTEDFLRGWKMK